MDCCSDYDPYYWNIFLHAVHSVSDNGLSLSILKTTPFLLLNASTSMNTTLSLVFLSTAYIRLVHFTDIPSRLQIHLQRKQLSLLLPKQR